LAERRVAGSLGQQVLVRKRGQKQEKK
jgi:hypothetical protein